LAAAPTFVRLDGAATTLVFALVEGAGADLVYCGVALPGTEDLEMLASAAARGPHESQPDAPPVPGLLPERKGGWTGTPAIQLSEWRGDRQIALNTDFRVAEWTAGNTELRIVFAESALGLSVELTWAISGADVMAVRSEIRNTGHRAFDLAHHAALAMPIPHRFSTVTRFSGRWAGEMREASGALSPEGFSAVSAGGKPGFGGGNWLLLADPASGEALGAHLAWSGDYDTRIECDPHGAGDGRAILQMAPALVPGEAPLMPRDQHACTAAIAIAANRSILAQRFHLHLRQHVLPGRSAWPARRVHLNSWEALGFDLSEPALIELASAAAELGVERFVLDDGWFAGRRDDARALGDWSVAPDLFPRGLAPLIDHVEALGMDFGLWVEPEMISPDSDLARAQPDWCLVPDGPHRPTMRNQWVLDLARGEVQDHVFAQIDALLAKHRIAYLKWDHNRDLFPSEGKRHRQTRALHQLLGRVRTAHPSVEIESCASGGGRIDWAILTRCHRVWPSDNNDPVERLRIIRAFAQFLPLEVLGNHVGPSPNPITGRRTDMDFRAKVALFGHMGIETDPRTMSAQERGVLAAHIALYKAWRGVLHTGALWRLDHADPGVSGMMVTQDAQALALVAQTGFASAFDIAPVRLAGLDPQARYRVTLPEPWPTKARRYLADAAGWRAGLILSGRALMMQGLALPLTHPETAWLIALERLAA
jgi:alpha-galactosidase